ncbi:MAG TPA: hypothetical protein VGE01_09245 [Fimbriimonas sp.]
MKALAASLVCLWLAAGCQGTVAPQVAIGTVAPDFLLIVVGVLGIFASRPGATLGGFAAGLLHAAVSGANMAGYVVSRTVAGFLAGWYHDLEFETGAVVALITTAFLTLIAGVLHTLIAPPPPAAFVGTLAATIGGAVYNGVLAMPFYLIMRPILRAKG